MKTILFVCKWNRFRSKIAEAYFNKINKNKKVKAESAGFVAGFLPLDDYQVKIAKEFGITLKGKTKGLNFKILDNADKIIVITNDISKDFFGKGQINKVKIWNIPDVEFGDRVACRKAIKEIMSRVDSLIKEETWNQ